MAVSFTLNGLTRSVDLDPATPLLYVLRNEFLLHGAKLGCGQAQCGACVVLCNGQPIHSCSATLEDIRGGHLETVEGLGGHNGDLHPLQRAFIELNAMQCGYCSAGILMRLKALLDEQARPTREAVCAALDGHLCRCGAHPRILRAVERAIAIQAVASR